MVITDGRVITEDGLELYYQRWSGTGRATGTIAVLHGYAEHSGRYEMLARHFAPLGFAVYACDLRGHGRSGGPRGHIRRFSDYIRDTDAFLKAIRLEAPDCRLFLLGHSLGG